MADAEKRPLAQMHNWAHLLCLALAPHCERVEIAGSIRRQKDMIGDIEIVLIPKPYEVGLFESGIASVINKFKKIKGELPCKYTQRVLENGTKIDFFIADKCNWGTVFAVRTGSADYSFKVLASKWSKMGYASENGRLYPKNAKGDPDTTVPGKCFAEEKDLFEFLQIDYVEPKDRNL